MEGGFILSVITMIAIYFLPTIFAVARNHHNGAGISILNLLLGWTLIGWVVALVWSVSAKDPQSSETDKKVNASARKSEAPKHTARPERRPPIPSKTKAEHSEEKICPDCAETIKAAAKVCRYCGYRFET